MPTTLHRKAQRTSGVQTQWLPPCLEPSFFSGTCDFYHRNFLGTLGSLAGVELGVGRPRDSRIQLCLPPSPTRHSPYLPLPQRPLPDSKSCLAFYNPTLFHSSQSGKWAAALHLVGTPGKPGQKDGQDPCLLPEPRAEAGTEPTLALLMVQCRALFSWS